MVDLSRAVLPTVVITGMLFVASTKIGGEKNLVVFNLFILVTWNPLIDREVTTQLAYVSV